MRLKKVLITIHSDQSTSQLAALLEQQDRFSEVKVGPALQANTDKLKDYEVCKLAMLLATSVSVSVFQVFRRLQVAENHLELLKMFPANFRFILLQHSLDRYVCMKVHYIWLSMVVACRSRLFTAYLIPTQSQPSVTKKGQPLQQTGKYATGRGAFGGGGGAGGGIRPPPETSQVMYTLVCNCIMQFSF